MDPKEHLKRKLKSHLKGGKEHILSPQFDPGKHSVDYWVGYFDGVTWGFEEGITIMEAAEKQEHKAPSYIG